MKIKIILLITVLTALAVKPGFAQQTGKGLYINIYGGQSLFTPGSDYMLFSPGYIEEPAYGNGYAVPLNSNGRYGAGFNLGIEVQKEMGALLIAGIDINYLSGKQLAADGALLTVNDLPFSYSQTGKLSILTTVPNVSFRIFSKPGYFIYTKFGVIVAFDSQYSLSGHDNYVTADRVDTYSDKWKYGLNIGAQAAAGVRFKLTKKLKGFVELSNNFLTVAANSYAFQIRTASHAGVLAAVTYDYVTFVKSSPGATSGTTTSTTSGAVTTTTFTGSNAAIYQHANNTVLKVGVSFQIK